MFKRVLVYKRTHNGDPDRNGCFGCNDCMKSFRAREFDAVIGIGGIGAQARSWGIDRKINWIGVGPHKFPATDRKGPLVTFDHFYDCSKDALDFKTLAPNLAKRMYRNNVRSLVHGFTSQELAEVNKIVRLALKSPPSRSKLSSGADACTAVRCEPKKTAGQCC